MPTFANDWNEYLIWLATPDAKHFGDFRLQEITALLNLFNVPTGELPDTLAPVRIS
jgi:hypothetical protein